MAAPTVVNGSFASPVAPSTAWDLVNPTIPGWTADLGGSATNAVRLRAATVDGCATQSIWLVANNSTATVCSIHQDLVFDGTPIVLRFRYRQLTSWSTLKVEIGSLVLRNDPVGPQPAWPRWAEVVLAATPPAGTQRLRFTATETSGNAPMFTGVRIEPPLPGRLVTPRNGASGLFSAI